MKELSLHILDIVQNSVSAGATLVTVTVEEDRGGNLLTIRIGDNGRGMSPEFLKKVIDPFVTTRTTRKVGMGIPLFKEASEECGGSFTIQSALGKGTEVTATFQYGHIDRQPLGDMAETVATLVSGSPLVDFVYTHKKDGSEFVMDTRQIMEVLGTEVPLDSPEVVVWLKEYVQEGLDEICGGVFE